MARRRGGGRREAESSDESDGGTPELTAGGEEAVGLFGKKCEDDDVEELKRFGEALAAAAAEDVESCALSKEAAARGNSSVGSDRQLLTASKDIIEKLSGLAAAAKQIAVDANHGDSESRKSRRRHGGGSGGEYDEKLQEAPEAVTFLQARNLLMTTYMERLAYYVALKCHGLPIAEHPVAEELLELRLLLEKCRPVEQKLSYQITRLLKLAASTTSTDSSSTPHEAQSDPRAADGKPSSSGAGGNKKRVRPRPDMLMTAGDDLSPVGDAGLGGESGESDNDDETGRGGLYRPPRLIAEEFTGDAKSKKERARKFESQKDRQKKSELLQEMREDFFNVPRELGGDGLAEAGDDARMAKLLDEEREREAIEEEEYRRMPTRSSKRAKELERYKKRKVLRGGGETLNDLMAAASEVLDD